MLKHAVPAIWILFSTLWGQHAAAAIDAKISFETEIPKAFVCGENSTAELSGLHYKDGNRSLRWSWSAPSTLRFNDFGQLMRSLRVKGAGVTLWIYNPILQANLPELIKQQFTDPSRPIKVVANLPYYITSPILMNLLAAPVDWAAICVMMQKEVAQRLTAQPGTKQYGALTLAIEYQMTAEIAFNVSRRVFVPAPNVDSAIVVLRPRTTPLPVQPFNKQKLFGFIRGCFAHRRKSLWNNLQATVGKQPAVKEKMQAILTTLAISPQTRPERLTLEQFIELANALHAAQLL